MALHALCSLHPDWCRKLMSVPLSQGSQGLMGSPGPKGDLVSFILVHSPPLLLACQEFHFRTVRAKDTHTFSLQGTPPVRGPVVYRRQTLCCFNMNAKSHKSALSHSSQSHMDGKESCIFFTSRFISTHFWPNSAPASFPKYLCEPPWTSVAPAEVNLQSSSAAVSCLSPLGVSPFGFPALEKSEKSRNCLHIFPWRGRQTRSSC